MTVIEVLNVARARVKPDRVRAALRAAADLPEVAARLPTGEWELSLRIAGDRELRRLNRRFLGEDHATDVLSFPSGDSGPGSYLGDIVISWAATGRQAAEFGHPEEAELLLLAVHGFLHLLGWDHATPAEEAEMVRLTLDALAAAGVRIQPGRLLSQPPPG